MTRNSPGNNNSPTIAGAKRVRDTNTNKRRQIYGAARAPHSHHPVLFLAVGFEQTTANLHIAGAIGNRGPRAARCRPSSGTSPTLGASAPYVRSRTR